MRRWGHFVYRRRKAVLAASLACFVLSIVGLLTGGQPINASNYDVESVRAANLEGAQLPSTTGSSFTLILTSSQSSFGQPAFESSVNAAVAPLRNDFTRQRAGHPVHRIPCAGATHGAPPTSAVSSCKWG